MAIRLFVDCYWRHVGEFLSVVGCIDIASSCCLLRSLLWVIVPIDGDSQC